ncbi:MAG: hypothetical protein MUP47_06640 [Phycisphaerae bacterium]|nr:hypothetical protein [Phycisphaerae bacterium]
MSDELDIRLLLGEAGAKSPSAGTAHKTAILERYVDVARLFGAYTLETLPTWYLAAYAPTDKLCDLDAVARSRSGKLWPSTEGNAQYETNQRRTVARGANA